MWNGKSSIVPRFSSISGFFSTATTLTFATYSVAPSSAVPSSSSAAGSAPWSACTHSCSTSAPSPGTYSPTLPSASAPTSLPTSPSSSSWTASGAAAASSPPSSASEPPASSWHSYPRRAAPWCSLSTCRASSLLPCRPPWCGSSLQSCTPRTLGARPWVHAPPCPGTKKLIHGVFTYFRFLPVFVTGRDLYVLCAVTRVLGTYLCLEWWSKEL